ncbi:MAG TPA: hypothetical protein VF812_01925 [Ktedonobacterales bacterium]
MLSGRSSAPSGRSAPEQLALEATAQRPLPTGGVAREHVTASPATSDKAAQARTSLPPVGRAPFDASERGLFWPEVSARHWQRPWQRLTRSSKARDMSDSQQNATQNATPRPAEQLAPQSVATSSPRTTAQPVAQPTAQPTAQPAAQAPRQTARPATRQTGQPPTEQQGQSNQSNQETTQRKGARVTARIPVAPSDPQAQDDERPVSRSTGRPRAQTLTEQIRSVQPPDVARQAINELNVLAGELATLARDLEQSGLARMHARLYFDTVRRYGELARQAWLSVAAERLEQDGASQDYRQRVVLIARSITRLRRESEVAASNIQFPLPRRRPYLWRTRTRAIRQGLVTWQASLVAPIDPRRMGLALFELRGAINTASVDQIEYSALSLVTGAALVLTPLSGLAAGLASIANAVANDPLGAASYALVTLFTFMLWAIQLLLTSRGRVTLVETLAGACFSVTRSTCNGRGGSVIGALAMRVWWVLVGGVGALLTVGAVVGSVLALGQLSAFASLANGLAPAPVIAMKQVAGVLAVIAAPAALVATTTLAALAAPALLVSALRLAREMSGARRWVPAARRYALTPALATLTYLTGALVALAWLLADHWRLPHLTLLAGSLFGGHVALIVSERAPLLAIALALPYLALIEIPFRVGLAGWRRVWLHDLRSRRTTIEAHVRRLSAPDPHTGIADTSDETLRAMQYDLVLLQFYSARITEAEAASSSPLGLSGTLTLFAIVVAGALLLDVGAHALSLALTVHLVP